MSIWNDDRFAPPSFLDGPLPKIGDYKPIRNQEPPAWQKRIYKLANEARRALGNKFKCDDQELFRS